MNINDSKKKTPLLRLKPLDYGVRTTLFFCAFFSILVTASIILVLISQTLPFFREVGIFEFLLGSRWAPLFKPASYGVLPLISGSVLVVLIALMVSVPLGLGSAIYMAEFATPRTRQIVKPVLEILAGVPTVVYGYFALTFITPLLQKALPGVGLFNALSAGIVVGVMILPMIASLSEDAISSVPRALREAGYALGSHSYQVILKIVLPTAASGISAALVLALSRAIGETMAVTIAAGATPNLTLDPRESIQTLTAYIVQISKGDTPSGTLSYYTLYAVASVLFLITFLTNMLAQKIRNRYREVYDH